MENLYGTIDLTKLGNVVRQHPELVRNVNFRDGSVHQMLNINVNAKQSADQYGNVAYVKVSVKRDDERQGVNYYLGEMKVSQFGSGSQSEARRSQQPSKQLSPQQAETDLPF